jgi:hypothetical protein
MKFRVTYILTLLVLGMATLPSSASTAVDLVSKRKYDIPSLIRSGPSISPLNVDSFSHTNGSKHGKESSGTQVHQSIDVAVHGSVVPVCDVVLSLIAVLYLQRTLAIPGIVEAPTHQVLFKDLFQVIIAPNAP